MRAQVAIIGAGNVGSALAQRIVEKNLADVVLLDVIPGRAEGIALDLTQAKGLEHHDRQIMGTSDYSETSDSDLIVITAGIPRKPGMDRAELLRVNAAIITAVSTQVLRYSPQASMIVVTNPLDIMTHWAWQKSGLPPHRVMGMAGVLDAARFQAFIALELNISPAGIHTVVLGGHGDLMVPLPRLTTVGGIPLAELLPAATIARLVARTRQGGAEIVRLLQNGSAFFAPASAACVMVESILHDRGQILPVSAHLAGEYGLEGLFMGVPVQLSKGGISRVVELSLTSAELAALHESAQDIQENMRLLSTLGL